MQVGVIKSTLKIKDKYIMELNFCKIYKYMLMYLLTLYTLSLGVNLPHTPWTTNIAYVQLASILGL